MKRESIPGFVGLPLAIIIGLVTGYLRVSTWITSALILVFQIPLCFWAWRPRR